MGDLDWSVVSFHTASDAALIEELPINDERPDRGSRATGVYRADRRADRNPRSAVRYRRLIQVLSTLSFEHIERKIAQREGLNVGTIGDHDLALRPHQQTNAALRHVAAEIPIYISAEWLATDGPLDYASFGCLALQFSFESTYLWSFTARTCGVSFEST